MVKAPSAIARTDAVFLSVPVRIIRGYLSERDNAPVTDVSPADLI
jgi:prephenate dehydrogenase